MTPHLPREDVLEEEDPDDEEGHDEARAQQLADVVEHRVRDGVPLVEEAPDGGRRDGVDKVHRDATVQRCARKVLRAPEREVRDDGVQEDNQQAHEPRPDQEGPPHVGGLQHDGARRVVHNKVEEVEHEEEGGPQQAQDAAKRKQHQNGKGLGSMA